MPTVSDWGCSPEALKAFRLIWKIVRLGMLGALILLVIFCIKTCSSSSNEALEINSFSSTELSGAYIPTVRELQQALCEAGYEVEVDCVVGDETKAAWNAYCADREAKKYFTKTGEPNEVR